MSETVNLVIYQLTGAALVIPIDRLDQDAYAKNILKAIDGNKVIIFHEGEGDNKKVSGAIRGMAIISFNFEPINVPGASPKREERAKLESKLLDLQKIQMEENIKNLKRMNAGDSWNDDNDF